MNLFAVQITNFPKLKQEIENRLVSNIFANEPTSKRNVLALIEMERAFLNTNHEDFFAKEYIDDQTIRQGTLSIENLDENDLENNGELSIDPFNIFQNIQNYFRRCEENIVCK